MEDVEDIDLVKHCMIKGVKKETMDAFLQATNNSNYWVCDIISASIGTLVQAEKNTFM